MKSEYAVAMQSYDNVYFVSLRGEGYQTAFEMGLLDALICLSKEEAEQTAASINQQVEETLCQPQLNN